VVTARVTCGVTLLDAAESGPVAVAFVPLTLKVYAVPEVRPETVIGDEPVPVIEPGVEVAVKVVTVPPVTAAVYVTVAVVAVAAVAVPIVGASGTSEIAVPVLVMPDVFALLILAM